MSREQVQVGAALGAGQPQALRPEAGGALICLSRQLEAGVEALAARILERLREALPAWMPGTVFSLEEITSFLRSSLSCELHSFRRGVLPSACPRIDALGAQAMAKIGELKLLLIGYRTAQTVLWEAWLEEVELEEASAALRNELLRYGSEYFALYAARLTDFVTDVYQREFEQSLRRGEQRRLHAIRSLLEGRPLINSELDFELCQYHLGLIAWGQGADGAARELAAIIDRRLLIIGPFNQSWWGWLSGQRRLDVEQRATLERFDPGEGIGLAFGLEGYGEAGFRATNHQALRARWVGRRLERAIVSYADVAVEALAAESPTDARAFVAHELRGIDDDSAASRKIRETIVAYFAAEHNAASAAAALGVHQQTVANRLRAAAERLGHPVAARPVELETALRLRACLGAEPR